MCEEQKMKDDTATRLDEGELRKVIDRLGIQDAISRYSMGQDAHQGDDADILQQWDETFSSDGTVDYSAAGGPVGTYRELAKWMRGDGDTLGSTC
jgi:hypothetical protein